jgi:hypothetical protein
MPLNKKVRDPKVLFKIPIKINQSVFKNRKTQKILNEYIQYKQNTLLNSKNNNLYIRFCHKR